MPVIAKILGKRAYISLFFFVGLLHISFFKDSYSAGFPEGSSQVDIEKAGEQAGKSGSYEEGSQTGIEPPIVVQEQGSASATGESGVIDAPTQSGTPGEEPTSQSGETVAISTSTQETEGGIKPQETSTISPVEQEQQAAQVTEDLTTVQSKVNQITNTWQKLWQERAPEDTPSTLLNKLNRELDLEKIGSTLAFQAFDVNELEDPTQKASQLNQQYTILESFDAALGTIADQLLDQYGKETQAKLTDAQKQEMLDATATVAYISNIRMNLIAEQGKVFDGVTTIDLWQKSSFRNILQGVNLETLSFAESDLANTTQVLTGLTESFEKLSTPEAIAQMTDPDKLGTELDVLSDIIKKLEARREELASIDETNTELVATRNKLDSLLKTAQDALVKVDAQNTKVQVRTFASRVAELSTYFRNVIASFFSVVSSSVGLVRAVQFTNAGYGADFQAQKSAAADLFASGASRERRLEALKGLQERGAQVEKSMNFAYRLINTFQNSDVVPTEEQKRALIQLRTTLIDHVTSMQELGKMIGIQIDSPRDSLGSTLINFVKQFYTPALLNASQENFWLLPHIAEGAAEFGDPVSRLDLQTKNAQDMLKTLDSQIFKRTSNLASALYNTSLISEVLARVSAVGAIGTTVGLGLFSVLVGVDLPFQSLLDWAPVILISGATLLYIIHYATYEAALKLSGATA